MSQYALSVKCTLLSNPGLFRSREGISTIETVVDADTLEEAYKLSDAIMDLIAKRKSAVEPSKP